jgi:5-formyltetrahydrofolate cyclo-ligase
MAGAPADKQETRERVWRALELHGAARFPGVKGRIPNFVGAERAALRLQELPEWRRARVVKINPDAPQLPVRRMALCEGKIVYMAVPRLREEACFLRLDPAELGREAPRAASIQAAAARGRPVKLEDVPAIDLIVLGAVAVNGRGARVGKGGGFADLEYALLRERGAVSGRTPVITTVHPIQIVAHAIAMLPHDVPLDLIVTPDGPIRCARTFERPRGIYWERLDEEKRAAVPVLQRLAPRP